MIFFIYPTNKALSIPPLYQLKELWLNLQRIPLHKSLHNPQIIYHLNIWHTTTSKNRRRITTPYPTKKNFVNLIEVFVEDFIASTNNTNWEQLTQFSRAMLHGIHSIFPPLEVSGHQGEDPISQKKLIQGEGLWETTKDILGWIFDRSNFTIQPTPDKCQKIAKLIKKSAKWGFPIT